MLTHRGPPWPLRIPVLLLVGLATIASAGLPFRHPRVYNDFCTDLHNTGPDILGLWGPNQSLMALAVDNLILSVPSTSYFPTITIDPQDPELLWSLLPRGLVAGPGSFMTDSEDGNITLVYMPKGKAPVHTVWATYFSMSLAQPLDYYDRSIKPKVLQMESSSGGKWYTMSSPKTFVLAFQYRQQEHWRDGGPLPILAITGFFLNTNKSTLISASSPFSKHQKMPNLRYKFSAGFSTGEYPRRGVFLEKATKTAYNWRLQKQPEGAILDVFDQQSFDNYFKCLPFPPEATPQQLSAASNRGSYLTYVMVAGLVLVVIIAAVLFMRPSSRQRGEGKSSGGGGLTEGNKAQSKAGDPSASSNGSNTEAGGSKA